MNSEPSEGVPAPVQAAQQYIHKAQRLYQSYLDRATPHVMYRWLGTLGVTILFELRIVFAQGVSAVLHALTSWSGGWKSSDLLSFGCGSEFVRCSGISVRPLTFKAFELSYSLSATPSPSRSMLYVVLAHV